MTSRKPAQEAKRTSGAWREGPLCIKWMENALFAVSGDHKGVRASGAKGVCVKGTFTPSTEAPSPSKAPHFTRPVPMTARFSMGGGNPNISDKTKPTTRGFAMEFEDPSGTMVFYFVSAPVFSTKTPRQLLDFVTVRLPGPDGSPDPEKIKAFASANPETTRQAPWLNARPVPASFADVDYWGVQAYTLSNAGGAATIAKLKAVAGAGQLGLSDDELKAKPDSFYVEELKERLRKGPVTFDFVAILGEPGDPTNDSTAMWPEGEPQDRKAWHDRDHGSRGKRYVRREDHRSRAQPARRRRRPGERPHVRDTLAGLRPFPVAPGAVRDGPGWTAPKADKCEAASKVRPLPGTASGIGNGEDGREAEQQVVARIYNVSPSTT